MRVVIIGGGLSGTVACLQLLRAGLPDLHITLVERRSRQLNRGVAYSAQLSQQLLNVPAARMGIFPEAVDGFLQWSRSGPTPNAAPDAFLQRRQFGDFVQEQFHEALDEHPGRVEIVRAEAIGMEDLGHDGFRVLLQNGQALPADRVVMALGNAPPAHVPTLSAAAVDHQGYIPWPWKHGALSAIAPEEHVVFVGSGLTMVDLLLSLSDQGHHGPVTVLSRRGFLPRPHAAHAPHAFAVSPPDIARIPMVEMLRWVRNEVRTAERNGVAWQGVIDAVRPHVQQWWRTFSVVERRAFMRHLRPFWEVHRHRMPSAVHDRLEVMRAQGRLRIVAARMAGVEPEKNMLHVHFRLRGNDELRTVLAHHLVNCTGPQADSRRMEQPLLVHLLDQGLVCWDELKLGLQCTPQGAVINAHGEVSQRLFLIGPMCKATLWECTAVPEIREQVKEMVQTLLPLVQVPS